MTEMKTSVSRSNSQSNAYSVISLDDAEGTETMPDPKLGKNATLERETKSCSSLVLYSFMYIMLEMWKQVTTYGMKYFNNNRYPIPQTEVVAITELFKFIIFLAIVIFNGQLWQVRISLWYALPSVIYAINNNIYYYGLHYATPPLWSILIQLRLVFTALTYRCLFHKAVTKIQWLALVIITVSIAMTNLTGGQTLEGKHNFLIALGLATIGSVLSVIGTVTMEYLFKNDSRTFSEMQMQLYLFGSTMAWILFVGEVYTSPPIPEDPLQQNTSEWQFIYFLLVTCVLLTCSSGIATAAIVKKLDNIVKLYTQGLANMLTSVACTLFFPAHFQLNIYFTLCLVLMFIAIFMYENKNLNFNATLDYLHSNKYKVILMLVGTCVFMVLCIILTNFIGSLSGHNLRPTDKGGL